MKALWDSRRLKTWAEAEAHFIGGMEARDAWKLWGRRDTVD